ncbi:hypothetical protein [Falsiroseomonas tokyonensis]|uniref:Uncharacterized protein n=1 Tax=Falsiroseomonas tokyonensis TaxID=430521 RepID=A0ABV7C205_9PROT|nr:hypothetical protein [Falsiroseomonas tokyonensis]MBU8541855.1 hypothetical protein [Falsiroseomonas tokyonensis]
MSARTLRRWIVLGQDGRHVTLGRAAPPSAVEIAAASEAMAAQGLAGWIATLGGDYWGRGRVTLAPVQIIGAGATLDWAAAVAAFEQARQRARHAA